MDTMTDLNIFRAVVLSLRDRITISEFSLARALILDNNEGEPSHYLGIQNYFSNQAFR